jgi:hypothetical protein
MHFPPEMKTIIERSFSFDAKAELLQLSEPMFSLFRMISDGFSYFPMTQTESQSLLKSVNLPDLVAAMSLAKRFPIAVSSSARVVEADALISAAVANMRSNDTLTLNTLKS